LTELVCFALWTPWSAARVMNMVGAALAAAGAMSASAAPTAMIEAGVFTLNLPLARRSLVAIVPGHDGGDPCEIHRVLHFGASGSSGLTVAKNRGSRGAHALGDHATGAEEAPPWGPRAKL
jgi:hypothetical protein